MIISFFTSTEYVTGADYSENPECIGVFDVEFDPNSQTIKLDTKKNTVIITDNPIGPHIETLLEQKARLFEKFVSDKDIEKFDWEGVELTGDDYNNLIVLRNFNGDKGAQIATSFKKDIKDLYVMVMVLKVPLDVIHQVYADDIAITEKVIESRKALGLSAPDISFLYTSN